MELVIAKCPDQASALTNCVYLSPENHDTLGGGTTSEIFLEVKGFVFTAKASRQVENGTIGVNSIQRRHLGSNGETVTSAVFSAGSMDSVGLAAATFSIDYAQKGKARGDEKVDAEELTKTIVSRFQLQFFTVGQQMALDYRGDNILLAVTALEAAGSSIQATRGMLVGSSTEVLLQKAPGSAITLTGLPSASAAKTNIFRAEFNFEKMGIGGLDKEFSDIFRRAFASRVVPASVIAKLGTPHVKGMLLYGPPGTGKTLIARQIGKMLNGKGAEDLTLTFNPSPNPNPNPKPNPKPSPHPNPNPHPDSNQARSRRSSTGRRCSASTLGRARRTFAPSSRMLRPSTRSGATRASCTLSSLTR